MKSAGPDGDPDSSTTTARRKQDDNIQARTSQPAPHPDCWGSFRIARFASELPASHLNCPLLKQIKPRNVPGLFRHLRWLFLANFRCPETSGSVAPVLGPSLAIDHGFSG